MADIRITPASSVMAFTSSLNFKQTITQDASGTIVLQGSGSINRTNLFAVDGNNGRLFSIDDDLSDSLFSVNTIAGLPVIEAFANNTVIIGQYGQNVLVVTGSRVGIGTSSPLSKLMFGDGETDVDAIRMGYTGRYGIGFNTNTGGYFHIFAHKDATRIAFGFDTGTYGTFSEKFSISATGAATFASSVTAGGKIILGSFPNSTTNSGEAWIGRAADRSAGTMTVQLGGGATSGRVFEVVDYSWSNVLLSVNSSGAGVFNSSVTATSFIGPLTGTAATATNVAYSGLTGTVPTWNQNTTGNAATATTLATARTLTIGSTGKTFNGSANVAWSLAEIGAQAALTNPVTGTGTLYQIAKFTSTGATIGNSMISDTGTYVGIGTTMPNAKLDIVDTMAIPTLRIAYVPAGGYGGGGNIDFVGAASDFVSGNISWKNGLTVKAQISYSASGVMTLKAPSTIDLQTVSTSRIYIDSTGNVGIGTTLPGSKLAVGLRASTDGNIRLSAAGGGVDAGASLLWDMQVGGGNAISHLAEIRPESYATGANKNILNFYVGDWNNNATSGTAKMTIAQDGNVGIGAINPSDKLTVVGSDATTFQGGGIYNSYTYGNSNKAESRFNLGKVESGVTYQPMGAIGAFPQDNTSSANGILSFYTRTSQSVTEKMRIHTNGKVSINNTDSTAGQFSVSNNASVTAYNTTFRMLEGATFKNDTVIGWNVAGQYSHFGNYQNLPLALRTNDTNRIWITADGNVGIGTTTPGIYKLYVAGTIYATGDVIAYSDESVKENIRPIENVIEKIQSTRGIIYDRTDTETKDNIGFIAQELEVAFPELVVTNEDGTKAVKYQNAVAVLFEAIKEQQKQIDAILKLLDNGTSK
jgi:hypothetical protein